MVDCTDVPVLVRDRVVAIVNDHDWAYFIDEDRIKCQHCGMWHSNWRADDDYVCAPASSPAQEARARCHYCDNKFFVSQLKDGACERCAAEPTACTPDDQPQPSYEARREAVARSRNPQGPDLGTHSKGQAQISPAHGVARAVANLSRRDEAFIEGAVRWHP